MYHDLLIFFGFVAIIIAPCLVTLEWAAPARLFCSNLLHRTPQAKQHDTIN